MILRLLADAMAAGASLSRACEVLGLDCRTVQRWTKQGGGDDRRRGPANAPRNKLTAEEDARLLAVANSPEFRDQSPRQIIPKLASRGQYIASEAHLYRLLRKHGLLVHRSRTRPPTPHPPCAHTHIHTPAPKLPPRFANVAPQEPATHPLSHPKQNNTHYPDNFMQSKAGGGVGR